MAHCITGSGLNIAYQCPTVAVIDRAGDGYTPSNALYTLIASILIVVLYEIRLLTWTVAITKLRCWARLMGPAFRPSTHFSV